MENKEGRGVLTDNASKVIKLRDGRLLGYAEYGVSEGKPVFYFHGTPSSRLEARLFNEAAQQLNARIISIDRPGMGISSFKRGRQILDWPRDVIELADVLGIGCFAVMGFSGGGPYAAAAAFKIPERLSAAIIIGGAGPPNAPGTTNGMSWLRRLGWFVIQRTPRLAALFLRPMIDRVRREPDLMGLKDSLPEPDRVVFTSSEVAYLFRDAMLEAACSGIYGVAWDLALLARPWGFQLQDISMKVHLWHGEVDKNVSLTVGRSVASAIPNCQARFLPDEGHFSLIVNHAEEILSVLVA